MKDTIGLRSNFYTRKQRLAYYEDVLNFYSSNGFISLHNTLNIGRRHKITALKTAKLLLNRIPQTRTIKFWGTRDHPKLSSLLEVPAGEYTKILLPDNSGNNNQVNYLNTCIVYKEAIEKGHLTMMDILEERNFKRIDSIFPNINEYSVLENEPIKETVTVLWLEN